MKALATIAMGALATASSALAAPPHCPFREPGHFPWAAELPTMVEGDLWAWIYLDLDKSGEPIRCYMGENNMPAPETRSKVCRSFVANWKAAPLMKDGKAVAGTTRRYFTIMGRRHGKLFEEARKRWLAAHPTESPACYEDG